MTIETHSNENIFTIENTDTNEDITIVEMSSGEFEVSVNIENGEHYINRDFTLSRKQIVELKNWIVGRLR